MRQVVDKDPGCNQNAVERKTSKEKPYCESDGVGLPERTSKGIRSGERDNFRVKLEKKRESGKPQND